MKITIEIDSKEDLARLADIIGTTCKIQLKHETKSDDISTSYTNAEVYGRMYDNIVADYEDDVRFDKDEIRIQAEALRRYYECTLGATCSNEQFRNFKRFILEHNELFVRENEKKPCRNFIKLAEDGSSHSFTETKPCGGIFILHPLVENIEKS